MSHHGPRCQTASEAERLGGWESDHSKVGGSLVKVACMTPGTSAIDQDASQELPRGHMKGVTYTSMGSKFP